MALISPRTYFGKIELIRFCCAFMIVIFHAFYGWHDNYGWPSFLTDGSGNLSSFGKLVENAVHNLVLNVDVFFLVSGFVITHILLSEQEKTGTVHFGKYFLSRGSRILPLYYVVLAITPLYNYFFHEPEPDYLKYVFMTGNFELINKGWGAATINPLWTLCIEAQFYFVWPFVIRYIPRKNLAHFFFLLIAASVLFRALTLHSENWWMTVYMHTLSRMDVIAIGALIALWYHNSKTLTINIPRSLRLLVYTVFIFVFINDDLGNWDGMFLVTVKKYFYVGVAAFAFVNYLFNPTAMFALREGHPFEKLGKITYGMYAFNIVVVALVIKTWNAYGIKNMFLFYALILVSALVVAVISYFAIERPFLNMKDIKFKRGFFSKKKSDS